jgi:RNA polymerase sigma factor (sigma-70 family)
VGDDRLVARVRAGDDRAFEAIYDRYSRGLLAFCRHMVGSRQEAEDALQHSFASAYRALRSGDAEIELRPWLYTIARNRCLTVLRSQRDEVQVDGVELDRQSLDGLPAQIQLRDELRDLVDDLQRLPEDQRAALVLFELGDHSHEQIADVLDVRREKVKALVFQARAALLRARTARDASCLEIRELLASQPGAVAARSMPRAHVDRCPGCAAFERDVRRQRKALAAILPVAPTVGLKASVLGFALGGGGGAAALTGAGGGATAAAGGVLAATATAGGGAATTATVAGALSTAGAATVAGGIATGTATVASGVAGVTAKGLMAKVLAVVAVAGGAGEARHVVADHVSAGVTAAAPKSPLIASATIPTSAEPAAAAAKPVAVVPSAAPTTPADATVAHAAAPTPDPADAAGAVPASIPAAPTHPAIQPVVAPAATTPVAPTPDTSASTATPPAATETPASPAPDPTPSSDPGATTTPSEPASSSPQPDPTAPSAPPADTTITPDPGTPTTTLDAPADPPLSSAPGDPPPDPQP